MCVYVDGYLLEIITREGLVLVLTLLFTGQRKIVLIH